MSVIHFASSPERQPSPDSTKRTLTQIEIELRLLLGKIRALIGHTLRVEREIHVPGLIELSTPLTVSFYPTNSGSAMEAVVAFIDPETMHTAKPEPRFIGIPHIQATQPFVGDITMTNAAILLRNLLIRLQHPQSTLLSFEQFTDSEGPTLPASL